ncbi:MAG TPA: HAD hydrolase family protein [Solirubrobacterales bacterium]|nr:HAD hydrolase family protein [Solirubrobacterales bacterium]
MALRCVYTDLDGTMLGKGASLLRDAEGNFSTLAIRALEACHRAGVEVVIKSGRRKAQVYEDARLIGQPSYIYEMGSGLVDGEDEVFFTGSFEVGEESVHDQIERAGAPRLLMETYPNRIEPHVPWQSDRFFSHLLRGEVPMAEVEALFAEHDLDVRLVDNGITTRRSPELIADQVHTYHLIPAEAGKGRAVAAHMRRRGLAPEDVIAIGDSRGDLEVAGVVGRFFLVSNALDKDPELAAAANRPNVTVTEEPMTAGFYEAIVRSLAEG